MSTMGKGHKLSIKAETLVDEKKEKEKKCYQEVSCWEDGLQQQSYLELTSTGTQDSKVVVVVHSYINMR